jgi:predicted  nucleic acid-binding Zn-ribbon protein
MSGPMSSPFTEIGRVESDVRELERGLHRKAEEHEVSSLKGDVERLERDLQTAQNDIAWLKNAITEIDGRLGAHDQRLP